MSSLKLFPRWLLLPLCMLMAWPAVGRRKKTEFAHNYPYLITADAPTYFRCGGFPGIGVGLSFARFIGKQRRWSAALSVQRVWSGTPAMGKFSPGEKRASLQIELLQPSIFWHIDKRSRISLGLSAPVGSIHRRDYVGTSNSHPLPYADIVAEERRPFVGLLGRINFITYLRFSPSHFAIGLTLAGGAILSAGSTRGGLGEIGLVFGGGF